MVDFLIAGHICSIISLFPKIVSLVSPHEGKYIPKGAEVANEHLLHFTCYLELYFYHYSIIVLCSNMVEI